jgi:hypothetical protein
MLGDAGQRGSTYPIFQARFRSELLDLVRDGLVTTERATMKSRGRTIEVARVKIKNAGRMAIEGPIRFTLH